MARPDEANASRITLALGGDVCLARGVSEQLTRHGAGWALARIAPILRRADLLTANWESPVLPPGALPIAKGLVVEDALLDDRFTAGLPPMAFTTANNHALDAGPAGVQRTRDRLESLGIAAFGGGNDDRAARALRVLDCRGLRVGFLGRTEDCPQLHGRGFPGPALMRYPQIVRDVRAAARRCDCLVVHLHHGVEFVDWPAPHMMRLCGELIDAGATVVLAGHPHVPQGWHRRGRGAIFYSLGNLVFDVAHSRYQRQGSPWTNRSAVVLLPVSRDGVGRPQLCPYRIGASGRPTPLKGPAGDEVLAHFEAVSADLADTKAMRRHWRQTALRYLGINLKWAHEAVAAGQPIEELAEQFFARLAHDENRPWVRELFSRAEWVRLIARPDWS